VYCVRVHPLGIPLRKPFEHAAHVRQTADPVVVELELADGTVGYGETLARPYVTGETPETVTQTIRTLATERLVDLRPASFAEALEAIDALPSYDAEGTVITAARAALELAMLDAYSRHFERPVSEAVGWLGLPGLGSPGSIQTVTYSGILAGQRAAGLIRKTRMMYWYGLRDFKLKVGYEDDDQRIENVRRVLGSSLGRTTTLRLDANSAWTLEQAIERLKRLPPDLIASVEQPLDRSEDECLPELKRAVPIDIMPDESLVTMDDARRLVDMGAADRFNIRISKNGGFLAALRMAHFARTSGLKYQLGCMVGETSILSAAGRRFIENVPGICFAEGSYGRFLLAGDITDRPVNFGCGGKPKPLPGLGWGVNVRSLLLKRYVRGTATEIRL
jgi:muconate cycloisomerase